MPAFLYRSRCREHELKGAVEDDFVSVSYATEQSNPSAIILAEVCFDSDRFIWVRRISTEDDWRQPVPLNCGERDGEFRRIRRIGDDLKLG